MDDVLKYLKTPKDWNKLDINAKADTLALSFIGMVARPKNIPRDVLKKCIKAFSNNRGKFEKEIAAILEVLKNES